MEEPFFNKTRETCVVCGSHEIRPLILVDQDGIPPGQDGHNIRYSHTVVVGCQACGRGQVEVLHHDCFDFEDVWDQLEWFVLDAPDMSQWVALLDACPCPLSSDCTCSIHTALRATCRLLPTSPWSGSFEADLHIHPITLKVNEGLPKLRVR